MTSILQRLHLAVQYHAPSRDAVFVSPADNLASMGNNRTDWDTAFPHPLSSFPDCCFYKLIIHGGHCRMLLDIIQAWTYDSLHSY
jgi:hypothetical protein